MEAGEEPGFEAPPNAVPRQAEVEELGNLDHAVLTRSQLIDRPINRVWPPKGVIWARLGSHTPIVAPAM